MNRNLKRIICLTVFCLFLSGQWIKAENLDSLYAKSMLVPGTEAPDMMIDSLSRTTLKDFRGRYVVLHFWASWCPDCRKDMPEYNKIYEEYASDSVIFINLSYDIDRDAWQQYIKESEMGGLQLTELKKMKESKTAQAYGVKWIPSYYVLNTQGRVLLRTVEIEKVRNQLAHLDRSKIRIPRNRQSRLPGFPGGDQALRAYLSRNVHYPRAAANYGIQGQTLLEFTINVDGSISDVVVRENVITDDSKIKTNGFSNDKHDIRQRALDQFAEESLRVIKSMPKWNPGVRFGIPFKTRFELPINYKIFNDSDWQSQ